MKKNYLLLLLLIVLSSCSKDNEFIINNDNPQVSLPTLRSADGKYRYLGFSYDVTGDNLSNKSVRRPVIDIDKMDAETKHTIIVDPATTGENHFYYGYSSLDYIKEVSRKTGFSASASGMDFDKLGLCGFCGNINNNTEFDSKYTYSSKYSFASVDITKYINSFRIADNLSTLLKYLSPKFLSDLNSNSFNADQFVLDYGTHVLTDITMGGQLQIIYRSAIIEESDYTRKKEIVKAGLAGTLKKIGLSANVDKESEIKETLKTQNKEATVYIKYKAGTGTGGTYDVETGVPTVEKGPWEQSVTIQNAGLVEINWNKAYPLYDFITDANKKAQIKAAVTRYIASKQINVIATTPIFQMYWEGGKNTHFVTTWAEVIRWQNEKNQNHKYEKIAGYIFNNQETGTIPLYQMYWEGGKNTHYVTTWAEVIRWQNEKNQNHKYERVIGYIFKNQEVGTVPLYQIYWGSGKNTHYVTTWEEVIKWQNQGHQYEKILGYVYPTSN